MERDIHKGLEMGKWGVTGMTPEVLLTDHEKTYWPGATLSGMVKSYVSAASPDLLGHPPSMERMTCQDVEALGARSFVIAS